MRSWRLWTTASLLLAASLFLALYVADGGAKNPWDSGISSWAQSLRNPALDVIMLTATYLCSWPVIVAGGSLSVGFFLLWRQWLWSAAMALSLVGNTLVNSVVKDWVHRPRPDQAVALLPAQGSSFPSGHTFSAFALYGFLAVLALSVVPSSKFRSAIGATTVCCILLVSFSRVYVGAHWPSDTVGSWFLGGVFLVIVWLLVQHHPLNFREDATGLTAKAVSVSALLLASIWLAFVVALGVLHPITESIGALGEQPAPCPAIQCPAP